MRIPWKAVHYHCIGSNKTQSEVVTSTVPAREQLFTAAAGKGCISVFLCFQHDEMLQLGTESSSIPSHVKKSSQCMDYLQQRLSCGLHMHVDITELTRRDKSATFNRITNFGTESLTRGCCSYNHSWPTTYHLIISRLNLQMIIFLLYCTKYQASLPTMQYSFAIATTKHARVIDISGFHWFVLIHTAQSVTIIMQRRAWRMFFSAIKNDWIKTKQK